MILQIPEMLFAGYAACFDSALNLVIKKKKNRTGETSVSATIGIGPNTTGFALEAALLNIPGVTLEIAQDLIEKSTSGWFVLILILLKYGSDINSIK
jgi:organic hydroperoxide reductase OsmC/OhrA